MFRDTKKRFPFLTWFTDVVVSGEEKLVKPDAAIYTRLLERNGLQAGDCLFIDDSAANVAAARAVGMQAVHFTGVQTLRRDLAMHGILAPDA
jgi:2-haloacid dehalogenase